MFFGVNEKVHVDEREEDIGRTAEMEKQINLNRERE